MARIEVIECDYCATRQSSATKFVEIKLTETWYGQSLSEKRSDTIDACEGCYEMLLESVLGQNR